VPFHALIKALRDFCMSFLQYLVSLLSWYLLCGYYEASDCIIIKKLANPELLEKIP